MKAITKKQFTKLCACAIEDSSNEELEQLRKGLYVLYNKLKLNTNALDIMNLNSSSAFFLDITCMAASETMNRMKREKYEEIPY